MKRPARLGAGLIGLTLIGVLVGVAARVALTTRAQVHPDEYWHANAFAYFEQHTWPPDLNAPELVYDPYGSNRVYTGELVYQLYGWAAARLHELQRALAPADPVRPALTGPHQLYLPQLAGAAVQSIEPDTPLYRLLNTSLLLLTLLVVGYAGWRKPRLLALGLTVVCLPQVIYTYAYANSDAWGLSLSLGLFIVAATQRRVLSAYPTLLLIGLLVGLLLVAKPTYWLGLAFTAPVFAQNLRRDYPDRRWLSPGRRTLRAVLVVAAVAFVVAAPLRLIYPLSQGDYAAREIAMRDRHALDGLRPSAPTTVGFQWAARGQPFSIILNDAKWFSFTARSFYGLFGTLSIQADDWVYQLAFSLGLLNLGLTLYFTFRPGRAAPRAERWLLLGALGTVALCVAASLYNSWTYDAQPQGRYLFGALPALALLLWGQWRAEPRWAQAVRLGSAALLVAESLFVLLNHLVFNPAIQG